MSGFEGKCAPFLYVAQCPPRQRDAYILASRIWIAPNIIGLIALLITFIRRVYIVEERFNTLRLLLIKFMLGIPLYEELQGPFFPIPTRAQKSQNSSLLDLRASAPL
jgi:hypothetical protein